MNHGSKISIERNHIKDIPDGLKSLGHVFFTKGGYAFIWPDHNIPSIGNTVWHIGNQWYVDWEGKNIADCCVTGYLNIPSNALPVILVESNVAK